MANQIFSIGKYPQRRMRRLRQNQEIRSLVQENQLSKSDLIWPIFITEGDQVRQAVPSMDGVERLSLDYAFQSVQLAVEQGISAIALFPQTNPALKDSMGSEAYNPDNLVCRATRMIRKAYPDLIIMCDVALDPYTDHGHDGLLKDGVILNDETVECLVKQALVQAEAGCDSLAPSDMMDGRIGAIRCGLDQAGFSDVRLISYAAKYASTLYGPFRDAVGSGAVLSGDKRSYQMNPANSDEALHEVGLDLKEGADIVIVKPGMFYLDIIHRVKQNFAVPVIAYQVSGEYSMIQAGINAGWFDEEKVILEALMAFKRAGANGILTYFAPRAVKWLKS